MRDVVSRRLTRLVSVVAVVVLAVLPALGPATALAAGGTSGGSSAGGSTGASSTPAVPDTTNPFSPGVPISPATVPNTTTTPTVVQTSSSSSGGGSGLSGTNAIEIALVAVVVLSGIAFFIWRDARRRAPVRNTADATAGMPGSASRGSKAPPKSRKLSQAERRRRKRGRAR
jgi:peptidoglycan/LPS O-acetylase OafA/YrhL